MAGNLLSRPRNAKSRQLRSVFTSKFNCVDEGELLDVMEAFIENTIRINIVGCEEYLNYRQYLRAQP